MRSLNIPSAYETDATSATLLHEPWPTASTGTLTPHETSPYLFITRACQIEAQPPVGGSGNDSVTCEAFVND
jgi:hypothetical protein